MENIANEIFGIKTFVKMTRIKDLQYNKLLNTCTTFVTSKPSYPEQLNIIALLNFFVEKNTYVPVYCNMFFVNW